MSKIRKLKEKEKKRKNDKWIKDLLKLGLGVLAIAFLAKMGENTERIKQCPYCNTVIKKFARTCPMCRNLLNF